MSIEELANVEITSASKTPEPLSDAAGAIFVISHDDIDRAGATSVPDMLRLAPNLQVAQVASNSFAIASRGFNGTLTNKLLVMIDGRSVYTPLYGGVYWDMQDVMPGDVDRIEVISGPGATLWGANAVNGVVNIITKSSAETQGGVIELGGGNLERGAALRYGGRLGPELTYRLYARATDYSSLDQVGGAERQEGWHKPQGGFRLDWTPGDDVVTLQGNFYRGEEKAGALAHQNVSGDNVLARWQHRFDDGSNLQVQAYFDQASRFDANAEHTGFEIRTFDIDVQYSFQVGDWNDVVIGGGERASRYRITGNDALLFVPDRGTLYLTNGFIQDSISLGDSVTLVLGVKLEDDPYSGLAVLPSARLSWKVGDDTLLWAGVSRAVRSPTPYDTGIVLRLGTVDFLTGSKSFKAEKVTAYQIGYRGQPLPQLTLSVSAFFNDYDDLLSVEPTPVTILPLHFENLMRGHTYGIEAWATYQAADWWRISAGVNWLHQDLGFKPGAGQIVGQEFLGNDPDYQFSVRSSVSLGHGISFEAAVRGVGALPDPRVGSYVEADARISWQVTEFLDVSVEGTNLLHRRHQEFVTDGLMGLVQRSFFVSTRWKI
ncbi:TonB-dependent receptor [Emcibacter sp. SYSU 3D8]|uniref:TonB-dependent receptor plug domain-containing protein n=1 Tax=Emcibacter sp. SYSU 3D8 TaxID=3133969 RepID=UPI0031FEB83D